ncbi:probable palmitoyltransferase ZDHHC24 [Alligator sinensis]|uniref:Palmitoyltransferase n=1 Tax=Alligator sinensis TaxID=38654 RepID=A0A3Q0HJL4_ALLSI|nr:probable palmitoyltransferase ZDHHC24 [Alligator sinensis]
MAWRPIPGPSHGSAPQLQPPAPVPPRGRHCPSCRACVLGRDHHCALLGQCVGHRNRRYFLGLLLHGAAALLYCSLLHADLLLGALRQGPPLRAAALLLAPWLLLLSGQSSLSSCAQAVAADACVVGFLLCAGFLLFHVLLLLRGQTTGEWFARTRSHDPESPGMAGGLTVLFFSSCRRISDIWKLSTRTAMTRLRGGGRGDRSPIWA